MTVLGIKLSNDCYGKKGKKWDDKNKEIKEELEKWENKSCCYKTKIIMIK